MIVVEGPDGAGKTTLVKKLHTLTGFQLMPRRVGQNTESLVENLASWIEEDNRLKTDAHLYDRHAIISETIYGPILRDEPKLGFDDVKWLTWQNKMFFDRIPLIIYCLPPLGVVCANVANDPHNVAVAEKIRAIYAAYTARAALDLTKRPTHTFVFDYTRDHERMIMSMWQFYINERTYSERPR